MIPKRGKRRVKKEMKTKMTAVASALIIGLMLIGVSYALWSKTVVINGKVMTGKLDAWFTSWYWTDSLDRAGQEPVPEVKRIYNVNIFPEDPNDPEYLYVYIDHLYPCIWIHIYFNITNTGTIPLKFQYYYYTAGNNTGGPFPGDVILTGNLYGLQLEPGEYATGDVHVHLNNNALQNQPRGTYWFLVSIKVVQWNEFDSTVGPTP
jgi:predicted ribosomally synthesized peptide with SipW-like signal peptide